MILVVDNYDSFTYNLVQLLAALGADVRVERNDAMSAEEMLALAPAGVVISPGPGTPDDAGVSRDVIRLAGDRDVPVLGVCLGHQCIAEVYGGVVGRAPVPVHGKTADVLHEGAGVLARMPSPFTATRYHSLAVEAGSLPEVLRVTARTADGLVMALQHADLPVFGVQFHPESVLTPEGVVVLRNFLELAGEIAPEEAAEAPPAAPPPATAAGFSEVVRAAIRRVAAGESLPEDEAHEAMGAIMDGEATPAQISALVTAMRMKGETVEEIVGFARAMRERATPVRPRVERYVDTCGTGGDGLATFNISTTTAFVVAGAGVPIAKHGNRAVSSASGSADVLEALGVRIDLAPEDVARCVDEVGVGFLFAQALHSSMRHAAGPRREIAIRTVFNVLGPLTNPAGATRQLLGVYDAKLVPVLAQVAGRLGAKRVLVVHGHPGMDEVSASGPTLVGEFLDGAVRTYEISPEQVGVARGSVADLAGGDAASNADALREVLSGAHDGRRDVVLMNAAAALVAGGAAEDFAEGVHLARRAIDGGEAAARLEALVAVSSRLAEERAAAASGAEAS
ncbi:MAG: anthranilate phosphoribosyltransferase [Coriobacteriia bacterium]|nr:anthranilate phosphoribosyltransferase [Coriobacteriia bacterium]